ncbi:hypothetical protein BOTBODRAFT_224684 [Botryobasidium botryosum FD-172 SS1]|uniref:F-box domain-containing protein n=1 Tax=Botryobasidium botryosum (strain FD-172 SS1) TaxID=930990 RepID=A0A067MNE7_BOTB1|nr:hypothetical protein BOTBODRAFT_224684 [Botryobasidium botryosum FD-172 SS1]
MTVVIKRIPTEILTLIFHMYKSRDKGNEDSTQHLFRLSLVCRSWREVIQGCPTLWSDIWLRVSPDKAECQATYQLGRAGDTLLYLTILFPWHSERKWTKEESAALPVRLAYIFCDTTSRWKSFRIWAQSYETQLFLDNCAGYTPNLSNFNIKLRPPEIESSLPLVASFAGFFPTHSSLGASVTKLYLNASGTHLHPADLIGVLLSCPNLVQFHLLGAPDTMMGDISDTLTASLPHLVNLGMAGFQDPERLLGALNLVALQSLMICMHRCSPAMQCALQSIFQTCNSLTKVDITNPTVDLPNEPPSPRCLVRGRTVLPSLKHFTSSHADATIFPLFRQLSFPEAQTIEIRAAPCDVAYNLLSSSPQLASALFFDVFGTLPQHTPIVYLPYLSSIDLVKCLGFLNHVDAPGPSKLSLTQAGRGCPSHHPTLVRGLIERSDPPIRILHLCLLDYTDEDILWCLRRLPLLKELMIRGTAMTDATLCALEMPRPSEQGVVPDLLLPLLESAVIGNDLVTAQAFAALAASRKAVTWKPLFPLQSL